MPTFPAQCDRISSAWEFQMRLILAQFTLLLVASLSSAQDRRVFYFDGDAFEQITDHAVTVTARLNQDHGENWLTVYVVNDSNDPLTLFPAA
jgi:hypothetical protein